MIIPALTTVALGTFDSWDKLALVFVVNITRHSQHYATARCKLERIFFYRNLSVRLKNYDYSTCESTGCFCLFFFFSNSPFFCKIEKDAATTRQAQPHDLNKSQTTLFSENNQNKIIHNFFYVIRDPARISVRFTHLGPIVQYHPTAIEIFFRIISISDILGTHRPRKNNFQQKDNPYVIFGGFIPKKPTSVRMDAHSASVQHLRRCVT